LFTKREVGMAEHEGVELAQVLNRREAALRAWRTLTSRSTRDEEAALDRVKELNRLADDLAEQEAREHEEQQRRQVVEVEATLAEAETSVSKLGERLLGERDRLRVLERETAKARQHDPAAQAAVVTLEIQEREQIQWYARQRPNRPNEWPVELSEQIAKRVEEMRAEGESSRARMREDAHRSLLPSGRRAG
jgi:hypothetical protein